MITISALLLTLTAGMTANILVSRLTLDRLLANRQVTLQPAISLPRSPKGGGRQRLADTEPVVLTTDINRFGIVLAAFMESFGILYAMNLTGSQTLVASLSTAWLIWLFLILPATILHFLYHQFEGFGWRRAGMLAGCQLLRLFSEAVLMARLISILQTV